MVVLDTDHVSLLDLGSDAAAFRLRDRLRKHGTENVTTTIVTYEEQTRGWMAVAARVKTVSDLVRAYGRLSHHLDGFKKITILEFDQRAAVELQRLRNLKIRIGTMDLRIAAIALANQATVLTRNLKDFRQVPGLRVEDWSA